MKKFVRKNNLEVINLGEKCKGKWTRTQGESRSVIDYVLAKDTDDMIECMFIDEERMISVYHKDGSRTIYSDHNAIEVKVDWRATVRNVNKNRKVKIMTETGRKKYTESLQNKKISMSIDTNNDIEEEYEKWSKTVLGE